MNDAEASARQEGPLAPEEVNDTDKALVVRVLRDVIGHDAGITGEDVNDLETKLADHGLAIVRVAARVVQPGDPDHPATILNGDPADR
jgi:hypothetical protein